jgi:uncharacterized delta-60 repeat protein
MKKLLLSLVFFSAFFPAMLAQINIQWQSRYASAGALVEKAEDMVVDSAGNVYVTGIGVGTSGNFDYITVKYNATGAQQWIAQYNGPGNSLDDAHSITIDTAGNVYVTGWSYGGGTTGFDYATVKYNSAGVQQWASRYNNTTNGTDEAWDVAVDASGNVFVTGTSDGSSGNGSAATTIKYNSAGAQQWAKRYDGAGNGIDAGYAITVAGSFVYVTGYSFVSTGNDFNYVTLKYDPSGTGTQVWMAGYNGPDSKSDEAHAIIVDASGNVYVTGHSQTAILTNFDYSTVKYNSSGAQQWAKRYNGTGNDYDRSNAIKLDMDGNVLITGKSIGAGTAEDILTIKYDNAGNQKWLVRYNGTANGYDEGKAIASDLSGNVYVTGYSTTSTNSDFTTIKYDSTGVQQWITKYNGTGSNSDQAVAIAVDLIGNIFVAGPSKGAGTLDDFETIKYCQLTANAGTDVTICNGDNTTLIASASGAASYAWLPNDGTLSSLTSATPVANPDTTTSYYVAITNTNGCVDLDTVVVTVVPLPAPTITASGPTTFCIGGSVTLTSSLSDEYQWSSSVNDTMPSITVNAGGTYAVTVADTNGCMASDSIVVTVLALPNVDAGPDASTCLSTNVNLMASGASTYVWHRGTTLSDSTISNPVAGPVISTTYTVVGTSAGGCINSDTVRVTIIPNPAVPTITRVGDTLYSSAASSYQWYMGSSLIPGETNNSYTLDTNGTYHVVVFNSFGCSTTSTSITIIGIGINEQTSSLSLNVFPNPANEILILDLNLLKASDVKINLMNIEGQLIYSEKIGEFNGQLTKQIDLKETANGIYYLQVITDHEVINKKIIKN